MSGALVKKGQSEDRTVEAFRLLRQNGIFPVPMLMHHDAQPLYTWRGNHGLLNQLGTLRKAGALYMQVLMLTPSPGRKILHERLHFGAGLQERRRSAGRAADHERNARDCFSASAPVDQATQSLGSLPLFLQPAAIAVRPDLFQEPDPLADAETWPPAVAGQQPHRKSFKRWLSRKLRAHFGDAAVQAFGIWGLLHTFRRTLGWTCHLLRGRIERHTTAPASRIPMRGMDGSPAQHALPVTQLSMPLVCSRGDAVEKAA